MVIKGLEIQLFKPVPWPAFIPEYSASPTRQHGLAKIVTDENIEGVVITSAKILKDLALKWKNAKKYLKLQDHLERNKIETLLSRRFEWSSPTLGAIDIALWDLFGKKYDQPVYKLLGANRDKILAYGSTLHHTTDQEHIDVIKDCMDKGFRAIKLHPYDIPDDDIRLCTKIRELVGDDISLMIDSLVYPGPYDRAGALKVGKILDELEFLWMEDPLHWTDQEGLSELCRRLDVDILIGERIRDLRQYATIIRNRAADRLRGNLNMGGISGVMKIANLAEVFGMKCEVHSFTNMLEAASIHICMAINNCDFFEQGVPEGIFDEHIYPGLFNNPIRVDKNGHVSAPKEPGIGYDLNTSIAEKITIEKFKIY